VSSGVGLVVAPAGVSDGLSVSSRVGVGFLAYPNILLGISSESGGCDDFNGMPLSWSATETEEHKKLHMTVERYPMTNTITQFKSRERERWNTT